MPLLLLLPLVGGVGFVGGFFANDSLSNLVKITAVGGGVYLAYNYMKKGA